MTAWRIAMDSPVEQMDPVARSIDGATVDWTMSGDAMRWSPDLADRAPEERAPMAGGRPALEAAGGLGMDLDGVRRLVSGALSSLGAVANDVVSELRQLTRGGSAEGDAER
jgi:hypothetical protein